MELRRVSYALLLINHVIIDADTLLDTVEWYDFESIVSGLYWFI